MLIVLDTNAIRAHPILDSHQFRKLAMFAKEQENRIIVPEVVVRELDGHIAAEFSKIENAISHFNQETKYAADVTPLGEQERRRLTATLRQNLMEIGAEIVEIPPISHEEVIDRIYNKKAPFGKDNKYKESGYKDFLIWRTVLHLARASSGQEVVLITNDKDFREGTKLHPDLAADADGLDISISRNVWDFSKKIAPPPSETEMTIRDQVEASLDELTEFISEEFEQVASWFSIDSRESHLPYESDHFRLASIDELGYADISSVSQLDDDEVVVAATVHGLFVVTDEYSPAHPWQFEVLDKASSDYFVVPISESYGLIEFKVVGIAELDILLPIEDGETAQPTALEVTDFTVTHPPRPPGPPEELPLFPSL